MPELIEETKVAKGCGEMAQLIEKYKKVDLLILDEWLIRPLTPDEAYNMLEVVEARCGQTPNKSSALSTRTKNGMTGSMLIHLIRVRFQKLLWIE